MPYLTMRHTVLGSKPSVATTASSVILNYRSFKFLVVLRHEKHPKGWIGVQLLGCSSQNQWLSHYWWAHLDSNQGPKDYEQLQEIKSI